MIYVYGLIPAWEATTNSLPERLGIDGTCTTLWKQYEEILAWVCELDETEFSQEKIDQLIQDPLWLQEKGQHHHERIAELQREFTVMPMSFCTIFADEDSLKRTLQQTYDRVLSVFSRLQGHHEWSVKMYRHQEESKAFLMAHHDPILALRAEIEQMPPGKRFLMTKKLDQQIDTMIMSEIEARWMTLQQRLEEVAAGHQVKPNWTKAMTGRAEDMVYNGVYLVPDEGVDRFFAVIEACKGKMAESGLVVECTGPWPAYHFAKMAQEA